MTTLFRRRADGASLATSDLDRRLRHTLHTVAAAMPECTTAPEKAAGGRARGHSRWRLALALTALVVPLTAAGYALGSEYVDQLPPKNPLLSGDAHGERYWMIPGRVSDACGQPVSSVELVVEDENTVGKEWDTMGIGYGDPIIQQIGTLSESPLPSGGMVRQGFAKRCGADESAWLADPTRFEVGHIKIDNDRVYLVGVHPSVTSIRVTTTAGTETIATVPTPARPDGPRYTAFDVSEDSTSIVVTLLDADGRSIPGGERDLATSDPDGKR
jgi:hypothetical protein